MPQKSQSEHLRQQTEVLRVSEERERDRWVTKVRLDPITYVYENEPRTFYAFSIANAGLSDVTVQRAGFVMPWAQGKPILNTVDALPVYERDGSRLEHTARLPKLLRPSESFRVVNEGDYLKAKLGGQPARPYCVDSLGQLRLRALAVVFDLESARWAGGGNRDPRSRSTHHEALAEADRELWTHLGASTAAVPTSHVWNTGIGQAQPTIAPSRYAPLHRPELCPRSLGMSPQPIPQEVPRGLIAE